MNKAPQKVTAEVLKEVNLFQAFNNEELNKMVSIGTVKTVEPFTNIVIEGEMSWGIYCILEGSVEVLKSNKLTGSTHDVAHLGPGSFFGEISLIDDCPRSSTVRATEKSDFFYISKDAFQKFISASADLKLRFYGICISNLIRRLRELDDDHVISQYQLWKSALKKEAA